MLLEIECVKTSQKARLNKNLTPRHPPNKIVAATCLLDLYSVICWHRSVVDIGQIVTVSCQLRPVVKRYRRGLETCPQAKTSKSGHAIFFSFFPTENTRVHFWTFLPVSVIKVNCLYGQNQLYIAERFIKSPSCEWSKQLTFDYMWPN